MLINRARWFGVRAEIGVPTNRPVIGVLERLDLTGVPR